MDLVAIGTAATAFLTPPIAFLAALWARRSGRQSADATVDSSIAQADGSITAARVQTHGGLQLRQQAALGDTSAVFLRAADALARTVQQLPCLAPEERDTQLAAHGMTVETAFGPLELLAPTELLCHAKALQEYCRTLENLALDRAVLRSAVSALEAGWCPFNAEACDHDHHGAAFVAWEFLMKWNGLEDEERWEERGLLEFCLQESRRMDESDTARVLAVADRVPAAWSQMIGGLGRDLLMERFASLRTSYVEAARSAQPLLPSAEPNGHRACASNAASVATLLTSSDSY
ncbi:hypothetical protein [Streptomyces erythrochromogenes]|uniref:hypothetical protein n=1 Tax=Streptomyces erythrochromogenes TaxID=285574 RepID=UPI0038685B8E|nr:hypothetical protein OG364_00015 [Streptomyces erythrochromogenes]WST98519.1 hypothetical protein OG364_41520 [Streptomyces erythrochromogenes]